MAWKLPERDGWPTDELTKVVWWNPYGDRIEGKPVRSLGMLRLGQFVNGYWELHGDRHIVTPVEFVLCWLEIPALPGKK